MKFARNATAGIAAVLGLPEQDAYTAKDLALCVGKPRGHVVVPTPGRLFSITTIARQAKFGGTRTVCVCNSFERAREIVETNEGDIWECSYMLVVIEEFEADCLYGGLGTQKGYWYRWNVTRKLYEAIETPEAYRNTVGFGIG